MVPAALKRSMRTKAKDDILKSIPKKFTLNTGHVRFFYNKMSFLRRRFDRLTDEMAQRGYAPDQNRIQAFYGFGIEFNNDWEASEEDNQLIQHRIRERIAQKPHLYT
jgi:deoxyribonuclease (pyrimidine dimer)